MSIAHQIVPFDAASREMQFHEIANIFPLMTDEELAGLTADIKEHGQREPIVLHEGKILDGRNRYRACKALGFKPKCVEWNGGGSAHAFVVSHNLHRRHLSIGERALIAAKLSSLKQGQRADLKDKRAEDIRNRSSSTTVKQAAMLMNVGVTSVHAAKKILEEATDKEIDAVKEGSIGVENLATRIRAKVPQEERLKKHSLSTTGKNPDRIETARANGKLWRIFKEALLGITGLPRPSDLVQIARAQDRQHVTDTKLLPAIEWLTEFSDAWTSPDAEAGSRRKDKSSRKAKETAASEGAEGGARENGRALREA